MVKAGARTTERMLEKSRRSEAIPHFRARRSGMSEADVDYMEARARQVDGVRRKKRPSKEEVLRDEASKLRTKAARLHAIADQLINYLCVSDPMPTNGWECVAEVGQRL